MLEEIYEAQLQPKTHRQELTEHHNEILNALNKLRSEFLKTKLWYKRQHNDFYNSQLQTLERYEAPFEDARERYIQMFMLPNQQHMNHPAKDVTRKDIHG